MSITWEMLGTIISLLAAMFVGFRWIAKKFDKVAEKVGKVDKKKVSHKTCAERRAKCPCNTQK